MKFVSEVINLWQIQAGVLASKIRKIKIQNSISTRRTSQMSVKHNITISLHTFLITCSACLFDFNGCREVYFKVFQRVVAKHCASRSLFRNICQPHPFLNGFFLTQSLLLLFHFCVFLSRLSELLWKQAREISYQLALKRFPSLGPPANGNESNAKKSRFGPNRNNISLICNSEKF